MTHESALADENTDSVAVMPPRSFVRAPRLRVNALWAVVGNFLFMACRWGFLVVITKQASVEVTGNFAYAMAVATPVVMFFSFQLRTIQASNVSDDFAFTDYFVMRLLSIASMFAVLLGLAAIFPKDIDTAATLMVFTLAKCIEAVSDIFYGQLQQLELMRPIAISLALRGAAGLACLAILFQVSSNAVIAIGGIGLGWLIVLLLYDIPIISSVLHRHVKGSLTDLFTQFPTRKTLTKLLKLGLPMGMVLLIASFATNIPLYFVEEYLGRRALGNFAACLYISLAETVFFTSVVSAAVPRLASHVAKGDVASARALMRKLCGIGVLLGAGVATVAWLIGDRLLAIVYTSDFAQHAGVLVIILAGTAIQNAAVVMTTSLTAYRRFHIQVPLCLFVAAATSLACFVLVPSYGLYGAAYAVGIGSIAQLTFSLFVFRTLDPPGQALS